MRTKLCRELGLEAPIFAFTRSREVVVEVSRAGGMGVLGALAYSADELDEHLEWIDARVDGKPYGVDTVMPMNYAGRGQSVTRESLEAMIPDEHREFIAGLLRAHRVPELPPDQPRHDALLGWSLEAGMGHIEVSLKHERCRLIANALGTPPPSAMEAIHERGVKVAALCGKTKQALRHKAAGVDVIVAQSWEAGGHTGEIAGMVLCPEIVDAVGDTPVLMAGGIGTGRQIAAALALGAQGAWLGSIWLTTQEHLAHNAPSLTELYLEAGTEDTTRSRAISGKPARQLKTGWVQAWEGAESPGTLQMPLQWLAQGRAMERIFHHDVKALMTAPVGQIVGRMSEVKPTARVMEELIAGYHAAVGRLKTYE